MLPSPCPCCLTGEASRISLSLGGAQSLIYLSLHLPFLNGHTSMVVSLNTAGLRQGPVTPCSNLQLVGMPALAKAHTVSIQ
jgi:hypothetical protein